MLKKHIYIVATMMLVLCSSFTLAHKFYVSVTDIDYAQEEKALQITTRIFIDDLENTLKTRYEQPISLEKKEDAKKTDYYIQKYFNSKFKLMVNGEHKQAQFIGREFEDDQVHCYLEITGIEKISSISIKNQVLFDMFDNQQNVTHLNINGKKKSFLLMKGNDKGVLNF